jgi:hypothetical protein
MKTSLLSLKSFWVAFLPNTLKMGQTSDPETLVIHRKLTPGNNLKTFKQHYDHGGSLQLRIHNCRLLLPVGWLVLT